MLEAWLLLRIRNSSEQTNESTNSNWNSNSNSNERIHLVVRSFVLAFACSSRKFLAARKFFDDAKISKKEGLGRRERFRPKIVKIGAILAIVWPFEAETPFLGELSRSSRDSLHNPPQSGVIPGRSPEFTKKWHVDFW